MKSLMEMDQGSETASGKFRAVVEIPNDNYFLIYSGGPYEIKWKGFMRKEWTLHLLKMSKFTSNNCAELILGG